VIRIAIISVTAAYLCVYFIPHALATAQITIMQTEAGHD
jgi:hypothetical protein